MLQHKIDSEYMQEALGYGRYTLGRTAPNPSVGAVVVDANGLAGYGWTQPPGGDHAEVVALRAAGSRARGATLYVTLEPCCQHGRTPPCTAAIIAAGIQRCVAAVEDPFPGVQGRGLAQLRAAGIAADIGIGAREAAELHAGFFHRVRTGRPLVRAKYAMTLDGKIATHTGDSRWITGARARRHVHLLRDRADAVMVGAGTVRTDNPVLTTRLADEYTGDGGPHHPTRVVVDGRGTTSPRARVYAPDLPDKTLVATTEAATLDWLASLTGTQRFDTVICLDAVIRGSTPHFDYVASEAAKGIAHVSLETDVPIAFGVLTTDTIEQAIERAGTKAGNKGFEAAMSALEMADLLKRIGSK